MDEQYWGLTGRPFQLTPDPRFWFETATHRKAMAYLGYGLAQGEGFIVITGDIGAGKTTLVGHLLDTIDRQRIDPIKLSSTAIEAEDLLRIVAGQLGVEPAGLSKAQLLVGIERGLHAVARSGRRTLLVVDEAQALPVGALEELRMLSNFQAGGHALLQIVLLGQPEFRERLHGSERLEQLRQRVIAIHHLDPMEESEVADYLAHRLQVVGWRGRPDFAADAFEAFHRGSGGVPRRLNQLAARVLLHASIERLDLIDARVVRQVMRDLSADLPQLALDPMPIAAPAAPPRVEASLPIAAPSAPVQIVAPEPAHTVEEEEASARKPHPRWFTSTAAPAPVEQPAPEAPRPARGWFGATVAPTAVPTFTEWKAARAAAPAEVIEPVFQPLRHPGLVPGSIEPQEPCSEAPAEPWMPEQVRHDEEEAAADAVSLEITEDPASDIADRLARLEGRVDEQDAALLRVLTLLVDWVEADDRAAAASPAPAPTPIRGAMPWTDAA